MIPTMTPEEILAKHAAMPSDIAGHLQFIHDLVWKLDAQLVVELGVWTGQSTVAILCALKHWTGTGGFLASCDIKDYPDTRKMIEDYGLDVWADRVGYEEDKRWHFCVADDLVWGRDLTDPIDLLLIDSSHQRAHTEAELRLFAPHVREGGVILLHDTTAPEWAANIMGAIEAFRADFPEWAFANRENCNGLGVMERMKR